MLTSKQLKKGLKMMNIIKSLKLKKRRKELREALQDLVNLIIVVNIPEEQDLHTIKTSENTMLSYATSYQKLLKKCQIFKGKKNKEVELSVVYSLFYALTCLYSAKYNDALENIKAVLEMTIKIDDDLRLEARYIHYIATIMLTHIVGQEVCEALENKYSQEKLMQKEIEKKIDFSEKMLNNLNTNKYQNLGDTKVGDVKIRVLENRRKLLQEYLKLESEINGKNIQQEFIDILLSLEDNLDFIENEMLRNEFIVKETYEDKEIFYPMGHLPNVIYLYLQTQRAKSLFYRKEYKKFIFLVEQLFHHTNYSNWIQPLLVLKNGNREDTLARIQPYNNLTSFNKFVDELVFEKQKLPNMEILVIRNRKVEEDIQYYVKEVI
jgi:hypothetical protein